MLNVAVFEKVTVNLVDIDLCTICMLFEKKIIQLIKSWVD